MTVEEHRLPDPITVEQMYMAAILEMLAVMATQQAQLLEALRPQEPEPPEDLQRRTVRFMDGTSAEVVGG